MAQPIHIRETTGRGRLCQKSGRRASPGYSLAGLLLAMALLGILLSLGLAGYQAMYPPAICFLAFSPETDFLAAGYDDGRADIWHVPSGRWAGGLEKGTLAGHAPELIHVQLSHGGERLLYFSWIDAMLPAADGPNTLVYEVTSGQRVAGVRLLPSLKHPPVTFTREGSAIVYRQGMLDWRELRLNVTQAEPKPLEIEALSAFAAASNGKYLVDSPVKERGFALYRTSDFEVVARVTPERGDYLPVVVAGDGSQVVLYHFEQELSHEPVTQLVVWDCREGKLRPTPLEWLSLDEGLRIDCALGERGPVVVMSSLRHERIEVHRLLADADYRDRVSTVEGDFSAKVWTLSPDARYLANYDAGRIDLWDLTDEPRRMTLRPSRAWRMLIGSSVALVAWLVAVGVRIRRQRASGPLRLAPGKNI